MALSRNEGITVAQTTMGTAAAGAAAIPVAGPFISAALGIGAGVAGLFREQDDVGVRAGQLSSAAIQGENLARMNSVSGMSQQDVQNIGQIGQAEQADLLATINSTPTQMSLFDRQRVSQALMSRVNTIQGESDKKRSMLDVNADIQRMGAVSQAAGQLAHTESDIAKQERVEREYADASRAAMHNSVTQGLTSVTKALNYWMDLPPNESSPIDSTPNTLMENGGLEKPSVLNGTNYVNTDKPLVNPMGDTLSMKQGYDMGNTNLGGLTQQPLTLDYGNPVPQGEISTPQLEIDTPQLELGALQLEAHLDYKRKLSLFGGTL